MNIRDVFRFRRHRRVIGGMRDAANGHATTVYGAVVTLAAFYTLWIVILHCEEEHQPHRIFTRYMEKGNEIIAQLDAYRDSSGVFPESLESIGLRKSGWRNDIYDYAPKYPGYIFGFEYIRLNDTAFYLGHEEYYNGKEQYLSSEKRWRLVEYYYDFSNGNRVPILCKGEEIASVFLHEREITWNPDTVNKLLSSLVGCHDNAKQQYLLTVFSEYDTAYCPFSEKSGHSGDSICRIRYNSVLQTFDASAHAGSYLFNNIDGYILLNGHICFVADRSRRFMFINPMKHKGKGQVFTALSCEPGKERFCVTDLISRSRPHELLPNTDSGHVWYLDFDFSYGGKATLQGVRHCP
ncbi:MAG: hypothetical protein K6C07_09270 [Bacteroidales bacterium]|nr:hypothetical protein [Bacteroidales bacterium]